MSDAADVVLAAIAAVEQRDAHELLALYHEDIEFRDASSLPYGGVVISKNAVTAHMFGPTGWLATWGPLQPTPAERAMDPRVIADNDGEVVVSYRQRAVSPEGARLDAPVLGLYLVRDGKLARAQMFHFDTAALVRFIADARK